jgi:hypothetical protein
MEPNKANHQANIVKIEMILPHPDPETVNLEIIPIGEYQVVVRKGEFKVGDLSVYIQPDSVVPQTEPFRFIWQPYLDSLGADPMPSDPNIIWKDLGPVPVPIKKRRITVRRFRKEWSEGLLMPLADVVSFPVYNGDGIGINDHIYKVGDDVSDLLGITHYVPESDGEETKADCGAAPKRKIRYPRTLKGWFRFIWSHITFNKRGCEQAIIVNFTIPTYDVESLKNYPHAFTEYEPVFVTEKIHGSNSRFVAIDEKLYIGSHYQWKRAGGSDVWNKVIRQHEWISKWCFAHPGMALYGESVPTQGKFNYGCKKDETKFFVFDVWDSNKNEWVHHLDWNGIRIPQDYIVPVLYVGPYDRETIQKMVDGQSSVVGANHLREGVVIKTHSPYRHMRGIGRLQLKVVSNAFLKADS